jgi:hypothetical protein
MHKSNHAHSQSVSQSLSPISQFSRCGYNYTYPLPPPQTRPQHQSSDPVTPSRPSRPQQTTTPPPPPLSSTHRPRG